MYRRPKFLETLLEIRQQMAREADYDVDLFAEMARSGTSVLEPNGGSDAVRAPLESFDLDDVTDGRPPS